MSGIKSGCGLGPSGSLDTCERQDYTDFERPNAIRASWANVSSWLSSCLLQKAAERYIQGREPTAAIAASSHYKLSSYNLAGIPEATTLHRVHCAEPTSCTAGGCAIGGAPPHVQTLASRVGVALVSGRVRTGQGAAYTIVCPESALDVVENPHRNKTLWQTGRMRADQGSRWTYQRSARYTLEASTVDSGCPTCHIALEAACAKERPVRRRLLSLRPNAIPKAFSVQNNASYV